ncbi:hypothetical protein RQP46_008204 [Phenoliferia psychrophenolica]
MVIKLNRSGGANYKTGYTDMADHGLIGNMRTAALVSISGTVAQLCLPHFDSPSVFARILDKNHGGHFSIRTETETTSKQQYVPSTNVLATKFLSDDGVGQILDFMPMSHKDGTFLPWLIRRVEVIRGTLPFHMECAPAFDYARVGHDTVIQKDKAGNPRAVFTCPEHVDLDLRFTTDSGTSGQQPRIVVDLLDLSVRGHKGLGVAADFVLTEGQSVTFILREPPASQKARIERENKTEAPGTNLFKETSEEKCFADPPLSQAFIDHLYTETSHYWLKWISKCTYTGRWREFVQRSAFTIKLLTFAPTGAIVAAPTFSLPEDLHGAGRNWDYRYSWLRDSSFSIYALLRLGFTAEADAYMGWLSKILANKNEDGGLQIMYTIHGGKEIEEYELEHLDGHKGQKPVRVGNGAANHLQLDIYGELLDAIYLAQKLSRPLSYDTWVQVRALVDYVCVAWDQPDLSIWEVRGERQDFLYSKVMCWVAIDRGLRLAEKRSLPAPNRTHWIETRDKIYEEVQERGYNEKEKFFAQSYQNIDVLDSSVLVMSLTFFMHANDPRFLSTLNAILLPRDKGGLTENNLVYRYDTDKVDDGTGGGEEGAFSMCTLWLIESLARAGEFDKAFLEKAGYSNHLDLLSEEISKGGEPLGNFPQAFSHVGLISTVFNVDRVTRMHH